MLMLVAWFAACGPPRNRHERLAPDHVRAFIDDRGCQFLYLPQLYQPTQVRVFPFMTMSGVQPVRLADHIRPITDDLHFDPARVNPVGQECSADTQRYRCGSAERQLVGTCTNPLRGIGARHEVVTQSGV